MNSPSPLRLLDSHDADADAGDIDFLVSPELVLVDPELARRARARLPDPPISVAAGSRPRLERLPLPPPAAETPPERRPTAHRRRLPRVAVAAGVVVLLAATAAAVIGHDARTTPPTAPTAAPDAASTRTVAEAGARSTARRRAQSVASRGTTAPSRTPRPSRSAGPQRTPNSTSPSQTVAPVARPPALPAFTWVVIPKASYYDFALYRSGEKIFGANPRSARLSLPSTWRYAGRSFRLTRGTYRWVVRPAAGRASASRVGGPIVNARLVVH